jgi:hypothetical protein
MSPIHILGGCFISRGDSQFYLDESHAKHGIFYQGMNIEIKILANSIFKNIISLF